MNGAFEVEAAAALAPGVAATGAAGDTIRLLGRVGVGAIAINEIAFRDAGGTDNARLYKFTV